MMHTAYCPRTATPLGHSRDRGEQHIYRASIAAHRYSSPPIPARGTTTAHDHTGHNPPPGGEEDHMKLDDYRSAISALQQAEDRIKHTLYTPEGLTPDKRAGLRLALEILADIMDDYDTALERTGR